MADDRIPFSTRVPEYVRQARRILDAGCGPNGSYWWIDKPDQVPMFAIDLYFRPAALPPNTTFVKSDLVHFCSKDEFYQYFDLCIADHILEHLPDPLLALQGINRILMPGGVVHVGIPDARMFTDRFYHLIHAEGGGHISKITRGEFQDMAETSGFELEWCAPWPDDWMWFRKGYDWKGRNIKYITQEEIDFIADVFVKELTPEKGYYYGWEFVLRKVRGIEKRPAMPTAKQESLPSSTTPEVVEAPPVGAVRRSSIKELLTRLRQRLQK